MKKTILFSIIITSVLIFANSCASSPKLSYNNQPSGELKITNETNFDLVIFAGKISRGNVLGGIRSHSTRSFNFRQFVNGETGVFLARAVKAENYEKKGSAVFENDVVFAKLVLFGNEKPSFRISRIVGEKERILVTTDAPYPVELRLNSPMEDAVTTLPPLVCNYPVCIQPDEDGTGYDCYPVFLVYNKEENKIISIMGKRLRFYPTAENEMLPVNISFPLPNLDLVLPESRIELE